MNEFSPKIVVFCCNWSVYPVAADTKKTDAELFPNAKFIKIMCGGMMTPAFILRAFELGADGVLIATCHVEDCHYITGARRAVDVYENIEKLLTMLGIESERLRLGWFSARQGRLFRTAVEEFAAAVKTLGPSPIKAGLDDEHKTERSSARS
jgi:F420-non-reducing hydrogenase iron-sulfur subunit